MIVLILGAIAVVTCFIGVILIYHGVAKVPDADKMVPVDELEQVKSTLSSKEEEERQLKTQLDNIVIQLEQTKSQLKAADARGENALALQQRETQLALQIQDYQNRLNFIRQRADSQAQESIEVINVLAFENEQLKKQLQAQLDEHHPEELENLEKEKKQLSKQLEENFSKISELEKIAAAQQQTQSKIEEAETQLINLTAQNESLKSGLRQITSKISQVEGELVLFKDSQEERLRQAQKAVVDYEEQIRPLREEIDANLAQIKDLEIKLSESQQPELQKASEPVLVKAVDAGGQADHQQWQQEKISLEQDIQRIKNLNSQLAEREKLLRFELTKSRTHALGLEKFVRNFTQRIEQATRSDQE